MMSKQDWEKSRLNGKIKKYLVKKAYFFLSNPVD